MTVNSGSHGNSHIFAEAKVALESRGDGSFLLRSVIPLRQVPRSAPDLLDAQAALTPDRAFMRQRVHGDGAWQQLTYADMAHASRAVAQWLLDRGFQKGDALAILSGPSIEHVIMMMAAQRVGVAVASLSVNFSLLGKPEEKLGNSIAAIGTKWVFVDETAPFEAALRWLAPRGVSIICGANALHNLPAASLSDLRATVPTDAVDRAFGKIDANTVARIMFTSGSTGMPKAVALTNGNLMASVAQMDQLGFLPSSDPDGPQVLDFMPYSHIFAGTAGINNALRAGATINLDSGRPTPSHFHQTIANLREISPSWFATAPIGYGMLVDAMEEDPSLRQCVFRNLRYMLFSGATLPQSIRDRLDRLALAETGAVVPMTSAYGSTEILASTFVHWNNDDTANIGVPAPGVEIKLVPREQKYELYVRGPNVMTRSGYIGDQQANDLAFDDEGFFRTGDAGILVDFDDPAKGLRFDGRFGEQFKLTSATYVSAGVVRVALLEALAPLIRELCLCGENRDYLGAIVWLDQVGVGSLYPDLKAAGGSALISDMRVQAAIKERLARYNDANTGSSRRIWRLLLTDEPLSFDHNEITDKGSINMRRIWELRRVDVEQLFDSASTPYQIWARPAGQA